MARTTIALLSMDAETEQDQKKPIGVSEIFDDTAKIDSIDTQNHADAIDRTIDTFERGEETSEVLEQTASLLENSKEEIPVVAAEAMNILLSHIQKDMGMPARQRGIAVEGLSSKQARQVAIESFSDTAKAIWDGIIKTIKALAESVKAFVTNIFDSVSSMKKVSDRLIKAAESKKEENSGKVVVPKSLLKKNNTSVPTEDLFFVIASDKSSSDSETFKKLIDWTNTVLVNILRGVDFDEKMSDGLIRNTLEKLNTRFDHLHHAELTEQGSLEISNWTAEENGEQDALSKDEVIELAEAVKRFSTMVEKEKKDLTYVATTLAVFGLKIKERNGYDESAQQAAKRLVKTITKIVKLAKNFIGLRVDYARSTLKLCSASLVAKPA